MQSTVASADVRRLSHSAVIDAGEVIRAGNWRQSVRVSIAASGNRMNSAPTTAGTNSQRGRSSRWENLGVTSGCPETGVEEDLLPAPAEDKLPEFLSEAG